MSRSKLPVHPCEYSYVRGHEAHVHIWVMDNSDAKLAQCLGAYVSRPAVKSQKGGKDDD